MIVKNISKYNVDRAFEELVAAQKSKYIPKLIISFTLLVIGGIVFIMNTSVDDLSYTISSIVFILFGLSYLIFSIVKISKLPQKVKESNQEIVELGITYEYTFKEQSFEATSIVGTRKRKIKYKYEIINKVLEYDDFYILRFSRQEFFMVYKNGFESQKHEEYFRKYILNNKLKIVKKIGDK